MQKHYDEALVTPAAQERDDPTNRRELAQAEVLVYSNDLF